MLARALVLRCPRCGSGHLFHRWFTMVERCPRCAYRFEREEGFALGASVVNLVVGQVVAVAYLVISLAVTLPDPPVARLLVIGLCVAIGFGVLFHPFSKTLWSAIDMIMRSTMGTSYGPGNRQPGLPPVATPGATPEAGGASDGGAFRPGSRPEGPGTPPEAPDRPPETGKT